MRILILTSLQLSCTHKDGFPMQLRTVHDIQFALVITYQYCDSQGSWSAMLELLGAEILELRSCRSAVNNSGGAPSGVASGEPE